MRRIIDLYVGPAGVTLCVCKDCTDLEIEEWLKSHKETKGENWKTLNPCMPCDHNTTRKHLTLRIRHRP